MEDMKEKKVAPKKAATTTAKPKAATKAAAAAPKTLQEMGGEFYRAVGRRKCAVARVRIWRDTANTIIINDLDFKVYFPILEDQMKVESALKTTDNRTDMSVSVKVAGGGIHGQADAVRHGISRALLSYNPELKKTLRTGGFLTRDPRVKERKKPGLKGARRAPQFAKR